MNLANHLEEIVVVTCSAFFKVPCSTLVDLIKKRMSQECTCLSSLLLLSFLFYWLNYGPSPFAFPIKWEKNSTSSYTEGKKSCDMHRNIISWQEVLFWFYLIAAWWCWLYFSIFFPSDRLLEDYIEKCQLFLLWNVFVYWLSLSSNFEVLILLDTSSTSTKLTN